MSNEITQHHEYKNWAEFITTKIKLAQTQTAFKVNAEMLTLYWEIGNSILEKQNKNGWGSKGIDLLANDFAKNFPDNSDFSVRNLKLLQIQSKLYERDGKALNNFELTLPEYQSDLAKSIFKDPYNYQRCCAGV